MEICPENDIAPSDNECFQVQTAAIAGLGLVYIGSAHRRMAEILLDEIGRPPGYYLQFFCLVVFLTTRV